MQGKKGDFYETDYTGVRLSTAERTAFPGRGGFEVIPSMEEEICKEKEPAKLVELLARQKAESVAAGVTGSILSLVQIR